MGWNVYLAGEIHSDWRERIAKGAREVDDIESEAAELSQNGVTFERYEGFDQDDKGIATMAPTRSPGSGIRTETRSASGSRASPLCHRAAGR
jgi:hypothetical protein